MMPLIAPAHILLVDDQTDVLRALQVLLKGEGYLTKSVSSPDQAVDAVRSGVPAGAEFDVAIVDMNYTRDTTSGQEGLDLLERLRAADPVLPIVVMTAWGCVDLAVRAMRAGASDFVQKPWENERLLTIIRTQIELGRARKEGLKLQAENLALRERDQSTHIELVSASAAMKPVLEMIARVGPSDANVLITGENGAGKGVVARALHAASARAAAGLTTVNAGGLPESIFESELFGHVKGAFTDARTDRAGRFDVARGGTLFLDEIGNLSATLQAKLLRVLETGEYEPVGSSRTRRADVRLITATNSDLRAESTAGRFRRDLYFRLNTIEIHVPPLRDRGGDIPILAAHFLRRHATKYRKPLTTFDASARRALERHSWPGNVRELDHAIERAVLMAERDPVSEDHLGLRLEPPSDALRLEEMTLGEAEQYLIRRTMEVAGNNVVRAAKMLGLSRSGLYRRLEKFGMMSGEETGRPGAGDLEHPE